MQISFDWASSNFQDLSYVGFGTLDMWVGKAPLPEIVLKSSFVSGLERASWCSFSWLWC